jgi:hypothetical protein
MLDQGPGHARDDEEKFFREKKLSAKSSNG